MAYPGLAIDNELFAEIGKAVDSANASFTAERYGREWALGERSEDRYSFVVRLSSKEEVSSPTRSLSALSRALVSNSDILNGKTPHGRVFSSVLISAARSSGQPLTNTEMFKVVFEILFEQANLTKAQKKLAQNTVEKIQPILLDYANSRTPPSNS